jgi:hypothetical protein
MIDDDTPDARYLARRRRDAWLVPLTIAVIVGAAALGIGKFLWGGDARWLLLCAGVLLFPRQ